MLLPRKIIVKLYLFVIFVCISLILSQFFHNTKRFNLRINEKKHLKLGGRATKELYNSQLKFILIWPPRDDNWDILGNGQYTFVSNNCTYSNCFITENKNLLQDDYLNFEAIIFNGKSIAFGYNESFLPEKKLFDQKYIFTTLESSSNYPICNNHFNDYFDFTFTYRLDSDVVWEYFTIYNKKGEAVGPTEEIDWIKSSKPLTWQLSKKLSMKRLAVAWFVSNCYTDSKREQFAFQLKSTLKKYNLTLNIIGSCGDFDCPKQDMFECFKQLRNYYFYLAFENSFAKDYVTEKVLHAIMYDTVPIVYGAANYSRFLPPNSYIDGKKIGVEQTAKAIFDLVNDELAYRAFFRWRNDYMYRPATRPACGLCEMVNKGTSNRGRYKHFRQWWNPDYEKACGRNIN